MEAKELEQVIDQFHQEHPGQASMLCMIKAMEFTKASSQSEVKIESAIGWCAVKVFKTKPKKPSGE